MILKRLFGAMSVPVVALALPSPALADDLDFVMALDDNGIYYSSMAEIIDMGKAVCSLGRRAPANGAGLLPQVIDILFDAGYKSASEITIISREAAVNMCPEVLPKLQASAANKQ